ncbi:MAG: DNA-directed RNA polymerase subunit beta [Pseudomonadota bacterium]
MSKLVASNYRHRKDFARIPKVIDIPDLIDIQKKSYERFLQSSVEPDQRKNIGLQRVFTSVFPIKDFNDISSLDFVSYTFDRPKYDVTECLTRGMTYAAPIRVTIRLVVWDIDEETGERSIRDIKEQEIYFGEIPLMTETGTFVINGTERVVVSQLHRSPGVFFDSDKGKSHVSGKVLHSARLIPYRGSWLDFEFDHRDFLYVRIDRRRKFHATILLKALGYNEEELLNYFYEKAHITFSKKGIIKKVRLDLMAGQKTSVDILHPKKKDVLLKKGKKFTTFSIKKLINAGIEEIPISQEDLYGSLASEDIVNPDTGEVFLQAGEELTEERLKEILDAGLKEFNFLHIDDYNVGSYVRDTLQADKINSADDALLDIYKRMRPGDPPTIETATLYFNNLFFNHERYDISGVGRLKINYKFNINTPLDILTLTKEDILATVKYLIDLKNGYEKVDDIDHLGNRRVRSVGELVENQYRIGLVRMERAIKERMSLQEVDTLMPHELVNAKPVSAVLKEFFGSSQLSQFMDQTNPISEITHKRRLSALGPGGMTRERAGFEVRDVHPTHYGRICPVETPEGPNIGLIASLSSYAIVNDFGFIETPYKKVENGKVSDEIIYFSALDEKNHVIAQANARLDSNNKFIDEFVAARKKDESVVTPSGEIDLMDVSPHQLVSIAASLIPFLEHDDANRALMGSNMQRQAVPLIKTNAPIVGTGMERRVAADSGVTVVAKNDGVIEWVDASRIVVKKNLSAITDGSMVDIYNLIKFQRSNQNTCINQKPIVVKGDMVKKGDIIADGHATDVGELALGYNAVVAFMPWGGYNFEDSILLSEKLVKNDAYTSIHIEEFECIARDTKLGKEEITRDIPNVNEEALKDLDDSGIIRIGAEVTPGDILVGKITPKGETQLSPEEKLLRAIFGEKAGDVKDTSLRVSPGVRGCVIDAKVFSREGIEKDDRAKDIEFYEIKKLMQDQQDEINIVKESYAQKIREILKGKTTSTRLVDNEGKVLIAKDTKLTKELLSEIPVNYFEEINVGDTSGKIENEIDDVFTNMNEQIEMIKVYFSEKMDKLRRGDELPPGVIKMIKVFVAVKRKISVGDKMAGRHGNKGVVSRILPEEDMPFLNDGTPVDVVLNPLGVPSRMNVGQILETHLGWAAKEVGRDIRKLIEKASDVEEYRKELIKIFDTQSMKKIIENASKDEVITLSKRIAEKGIHVATRVFDGANEHQVKALLKKAGLPENGQVDLWDGRNGEKFKNQVTVGVMYIMKLHHLVDDKIHARSIGPYSLVTQQPLGGKAQFGGQRLGEMEVWALEAYGAAHCLQEFLTVKSDDIQGRTKMYETIVKREASVNISMPESFKVLVKELQGLGLLVDLVNRDELNADGKYVAKLKQVEE